MIQGVSAKKFWKLRLKNKNVSNTNKFLMFSLNNSILLRGVNKRILMNDLEFHVKIFVLKSRAIICSYCLNIILKMIFNISNESLNKFWGFIFTIHKVNPIKKNMIINHSKKLLMTNHGWNWIRPKISMWISSEQLEK